jgi:hypothetical protein
MSQKNKPGLELALRIVCDMQRKQPLGDEYMLLNDVAQRLRYELMHIPHVKVTHLSDIHNRLSEAHKGGAAVSVELDGHEAGRLLHELSILRRIKEIFFGKETFE